MARPFDISKFRKSITKSVPGLSVGFNDPDTWVSTGNYTLNKLISGDFNKGIPLGKVTVFAGESGAGKSYIASGNLVRHAQEQGIFVVLIDSENALDEAWLKALNVDTDDSKLLKLNLAMIDDVAKVVSDFMKDYKSNYGDLPYEDQPKLIFVIDSLGMLLTLLFPSIYLKIAGCFLTGIGISTIVPLIYSQAGNQKEIMPSIAIAGVSTIAYIGFLLGPVIIGYLSDFVGLDKALYLLVILGFVAAFISKTFASAK